MAQANLVFWLLLLVHCRASEKRAPTLYPGDGRKRDWPKILEHVELEWVNKNDDCARDGKDGDNVAFNHNGFIADLPPGKSTDAQGRLLRNGIQIDSNMDPETKQPKPLEFVLGTQKLIVGMEAALRTMCVGETVRATIPGPLAYNGRANFLPYNTKVMYQMELVSFTKGDGLPKEPGPEATTAKPAGGSGWPLAVALALLLLVLGSAAFAMSKFEQQGRNRKKAKDAKKEGKKKR
mmetsp:Transcript_27527/g.37181  ORF Transcript_27527/g.37181 Transcript_27527/m.37181 type:complete len:236 (+) Transcript_27527:70-777(+)